MITNAHARGTIPGILLFTLMAGTLSAQTDTTRHGWPVTPFFETHPITGVFCEFRNTLSANHFHNGVDVPKPDGSPVYSVFDGIVTGIGTTASSGTNAYVRVEYRVGGLLKTDAYVHIGPNPLLGVGDSVKAYQTVLGNILPGLGHVHFTHGRYDQERNAIRPNGGFTPYTDLYPPSIESVRFFVDGAETEFPPGRVSGRVDIRVHIRETSAGSVGDLTSSTTNNGTYAAGYAVLSADGATVVYEPPSAGVRFRFDRKPSDDDVGNVFATGSDLSTHIYTVTNGAGADAVNSTLRVPNNAWDTGTVPPGPYIVKVWAEDTRGLRDSVLVPVSVQQFDIIPPAVPVLRAVVNDSTNRITVRWSANAESDLAGYRLDFSLNGTTWTKKDDESKLGRGATSVSYTTASGRIFFRLAAVDSASPPNVSGYSDIYGVRLNSTARRTLIVDGFDRFGGSGSWSQATHPFAMTAGLSMPEDFSSCSNDAVLDGSVRLEDFGAVVWLLGDESSTDETFTAQEQQLVAAYLTNGGNLFVHGSEVAYDLDRPAGPTQADRDFLHDYLKAAYAGDDAAVYSVVGAPGTSFSDVSLRYGVVAEGSPYEEDWPDFSTAAGGGQPVLHYGTSGSLVAATGYRGLFPGGTSDGAVVTMGFPLETITTKAARDTLLRRVYGFFDIVSGVDDRWTPVPGEFALEQNYPNPFNPTTEIRYQVSGVSNVKLVVYDILGREVATLIEGTKESGRHVATFDAAGLASGVYIYRLTAASLTAAKTMILLR